MGREPVGSYMQKVTTTRAEAEKRGRRRMTTQLKERSGTNSRRRYVLLLSLSLRSIVMPNSIVLRKEIRKGMESVRVETRNSWNTAWVENVDKRMREERIKTLALKKVLREKGESQGEKSEPGKEFGLRNVAPARWRLGLRGDVISIWNREESTMETSGDETRATVTPEKPI